MHETGAVESSARLRHFARTLPAWTMAVAMVSLVSSCAPKPSSVTTLVPPEAPGGHSSDPTIALDPANHDVLIAWLAGDSTDGRVWFSRSTDAGAHWLTPVAVSPPGESLGMRGEEAPRLACDAGGRVAIMWATSIDVPGRSRPPRGLRFVRSLDRGATWSAPITPYADVYDTARTQRFLDLASSDDGKLVSAWIENQVLEEDGAHRAASPRAAVLVATSNDFGEHWGQASAEWSQPCPCSRVAVAIDLTGAAFVAFRQHLDDGGCDVTLGQPRSASARASHDGWNLDGCPRPGPGFKVARDGTLRVAWFTGAPGRTGVWFRQGLPAYYDTTATLLPLLTADSLPMLHVSLGDAGRSGTVIACDGDSTGGGALSLIRVEASGRRIVERIVPPGFRNVRRPQVAASNRSRRAYVAWTDGSDGDRHLRLLRWDVGR